MKKLDRFILKSYVGPFFAILLVVVFILMMQFLWLYIDELVGKGLSLKVILEFLFWGSVTTLPLSLPLAVLLSAVMTLGSFGENYELTAMKSAGISLTRIMAPLFAATLVICTITFFVCNNLVPVAYNEIYTLRDDINHTKNEIKIPEGTFYNGIDGYILRIDKRDKESGTMFGVIVYDHTGRKGNTSMTVADSAHMDMSKDKAYLTFTLFNGTNYEESNTRKYRDTTLALQKTNFTRQEMIIPLENYAFEKSDSARFSDEVNSMKISQLRIQQDSLNAIKDTLHRQHLDGLTQARTLRHNTQLDTSRHSGIRTEYEYADTLKWKDLDQEIEAYEKTLESINEYIATLAGYSRDSYRNTFILRRTDVGILKKYANALACLIMLFLGAPIGALVRKKGIGTPVIIAVLFFVLYWVIDITGTKLAKNGAASAFNGVFISLYVLLPLGLYMTWRAVNDASIINMDVLTTRFRAIKRKIKETMRGTRIVYMGTPDFAVAPLDELIKSGYKIVGVVTTPDKASGRGLKVNESAVKKYALEHDIPILQPEKLKDPAFIESLKAWKPDLFVVVAFRMLPKVVWEIPELGTFNLHAALLPQYRGAAPINWAVINGEQMTGVTTFMIDDGIDTGKIMLREQCRIGESDTVGDIHDKLMEIGAKAVVTTVESIIDHDVELRVQKSFIQGAELLKPAPKLTRELCHIDWDASTKEVYNLIRGLSPYPAAYTELIPAGGGAPMQMKVYFGEKIGAEKTRELAAECGKEGAAPGTVLSDSKTYLAITTCDGAVSITDLQLAGKKRMDVKAFLLGFREPCSYATTKGTSSAIIAANKAREE